MYFKKVLKYANISDFKLVYYSIISSINFQKNLKELENKKFIHLFQLHIGFQL